MAKRTVDEQKAKGPSERLPVEMAAPLYRRKPALAAAVVLFALVGAVLVYAFTREAPRTGISPPPASVAPSSAPSTTASAAPAVTFEAFMALPDDQKKGVVEAA